MNSAERHIVCILNGSRPTGEKVERLLRKIAAQTTWTSEVHATRYAKHAIELAEAAAAKATHVVAVGGDGTLHEVVNGLLRAGSTAYFAFIPNGTGNDYQRSFAPWNEESWWAAFVANDHVCVDLCRVEGAQGTHYALNIAGCGFDGHVVRLLNRQRAQWNLKGKTSYATAIVRAFFSYRKPTLNIQSAEFKWQGKALMLVACKGSTFGHGLIIAPDAQPYDGVLHCVLLGNVSLMDYVRNLGNLKKGRKIVHPAVHYFNATQVNIQLESGTLYQESDGESGAGGSLEVSVVPAAIRLIHP